MSDIPVEPGERVAETPEGDLVAVSCTRSVQGAVVHYHAIARAIDPAGSQRVDGVGTPIIRELRHQARGAAQVEEVTADCERAVLGEEPQLVMWGDDLLADVSIREAISLAPFAG